MTATVVKEDVRAAKTAGGGLEGLGSVPDEVARTTELIAAFDQCLSAGFGRLGSDQAAALDALALAVDGTPLGKGVAQALLGIRANEFRPEHFAALASARAALQGACYDALLAQASEALGRAVPDGSGGTVGKPKPNVLCESARHWLMEVAITGFQQLDASTLAPFAATLENLQADASLGRLSSLLTGYWQELLGALPIGRGAGVPAYRWADLWTRSFVSTLQAERPEAVEAKKVSGTFTALGVDVRQHASFVSAVVYGLLEPQPRVVRVTLSSYKVDALQGREVWRCFAADERNLPLLKAVAEHVPLKVTGMSLLPTGDLLWDGKATEAGKAVDVFALAAKALSSGSGTLFPGVAPPDRHPVQLGELVCLGETGLDVTRVPVGMELTGDDLKRAKDVIGLLRFDAGKWQLQPLAVKGAHVGQSAYDVATKKPKKGEPNTLAVLKERAGRLLRKKS